MFIQDLSGRRGSGGSLGRVYLWRCPARAAARAVWGGLQGWRGGFETRSAERGWFWPKLQRRPSRVRISMAPCSEGGGAGRVWWSRGQHSRLSTRAPTFNSRIPCGRAAIAFCFWGRFLARCGLNTAYGLALRAELRLLVLLRSVRDLCPRRTRVAALTLTALCTQ